MSYYSTNEVVSCAKLYCVIFIIVDHCKVEGHQEKKQTVML